MPNEEIVRVGSASEINTADPLVTGILINSFSPSSYRFVLELLLLFMRTICVTSLN